MNNTIQVLKDRNVGYESDGTPNNVYVFAIATSSNLPSTTYTDQSGSKHNIMLGSAAVDMSDGTVYGFDGSAWSANSGLVICL